MRLGRWQRVCLAMLLTVLSLGSGAATAQINPNNPWAATAARTCDDNSVIVRWVGDTIDNIEFSATDTSLDWTTGIQPVDDVASGIHEQPIGVMFDKLMVRANFVDGTTSEITVETGQCSDTAVEPEIYFVDPDKLVMLDGFVRTSDNQYLEGAEVCILERSKCTTAIGQGYFAIGNLPQTTYTIVANLDGYVGETIVINVSGADLTTIDVVLDRIPPVTPAPTAPGAPGHSGPEPHDGSYSDPVTGNRFEFLTAVRMCDDNSFNTTYAGKNMTDVHFMVYSPANAWGGTEWLTANVDSGSFTIEVQQDTAYKVDAAVTFTNGDVQIISRDLADCTAGPPVPTIGESTLTVQLNLPGGENVEGAPWDLYAPQAAAQVSLLPYTSGVVGANNMIEIPGLIAGEYRLVVSPTGMAPIEATLTVSNQPVTAATITVAADGTVSVAYAAQVAPTTAPGETPQPTATQATGSGNTGSGTTGSGSGSGVSGLPETGTGAESSATSSVIIALATAASVLAVGSLMIRRKQA